MFAIHLNAKNDPSGNPRRVYLICGPHGPVAAVDEGYAGRGAIREAGFEAPEVWNLDITPGEYRRVLRQLGASTRVAGKAARDRRRSR